MGAFQLHRPAYSLLFSLTLLVAPCFSAATTDPSPPPPVHDLIGRISTIEAKDHGNGTCIEVMGNGRIPSYQTRILRAPSRIVVDIPSRGMALHTQTIPINKPDLRQIRVGYHHESIRLVFDVEEATIENLSTQSTGNGLEVFLGEAPPLERGNVGRPEEAGHGGPESPAGSPQPPVSVGKRVEEQTGPVPPPKKPAALETEKPTAGTRLLHDEVLAFAVSPSLETGGNRAAAELFFRAAGTYRAGNWTKTIEHLNNLIAGHSSGPYAEKAYFLLAKCYGQLYADAVPAHFEDLKITYEDAIYRFPESPYLAEAFFSLGNLSIDTGNYHEALGYYNLVAEKAENPLIAQKAIMRKVKILRMKNRGDEAYVILKNLLDRYPESAVNSEAQLEMAKILFGMNSLSRSLDILTKLKTDTHQNLYRHPEISLYLGYNHFQVGNYDRARENLYRFYNMDPANDENHLVLTKIADAYRASSLPDYATKIYQLVLERYPSTEGALISLTRLADQQESGELKINRDSVVSVQLVGKKIDIPRRLYEDVIESLRRKDSRNPLLQLAMLRLAVLYQREGDHDKSYVLLKELLAEYPRSTLKKEVMHAMGMALKPILANLMKQRQYVRVANMYRSESDLVSELESPEIYLVFAQALDRMKLNENARTMYIAADQLLPDKEKPSELLYFLARDSVAKKRFEGALERLDLLIDMYPSFKNLPQVYQLKGNVLFSQNRYQEAVKVFDLALKHRLGRPEKIRILIDKTRMLMAAEAEAEALQTVKEASRLLRLIQGKTYSMSRDIGDLYRKLGQPGEAVSVFEHALQTEASEDNRIRLRLALAECYEALHQSEKYLALYRQISELDDPFWSHLARERMEAEDFKRTVKDTP